MSLHCFMYGIIDKQEFGLYYGINKKQRRDYEKTHF